MANIDLGTIVIVGASISLIQEFLQSKSWSNTVKKALAVILSLGAAAVYVAFKDSAFWTTFVSILASASAVYALVIKDLFSKK